nr:isoprenylcysteine carboxylmethyltransferase family protein [uncultured Mucilaginibacter sp.]
MEISYYDITLAFGLSEVVLAVVKRSKKTQVKSNADKNSLLVLWVCIAGGLMLGGFAPHYINLTFPALAWIHNAGLVVLLAGFLVRWLAILQLGKMFTVNVSINSGHQLKTNGLYGLVRHPSYLGALLILLGIGLFTGDAAALIVVFIPPLLAFIYRMHVEENALVAEFGPEYVDYKNKVARIIPGVY